MNKAALYLRSSFEDASSDSLSESIKNQQELLLNYAMEHDFEIKKIYVDEGYSNNIFDRSNFKRLIDDIQNHEINTVISADLASVSNDCFPGTHYMENYFNQHNVRFISINDKIDASKNYTNDITSKTETQFTGSIAPYGYKKSENNNHQLVIDEETAPNIKLIFHLYLSGYSLLAISNTLSELKIPTPSQAKNLKSTQKHFIGIWNEVMIKRILTSQVYLGNLTKKNARSNPQADQDEYIVYNTHEAIIEKETFDSVQSKFPVHSVNRKKKTEHLLTGLVFCGDCNSPMTVIKKDKSKSYLVCSSWKKHSSLHICTSHSIREDVVINLVLTELYVLAKDIDTNEIFQTSKNISDNKKLINTFENKISESKTALLSLYKDKCKGIISDDDYIFMSDNFKKEISFFQDQLDCFNEIQQEQKISNEVIQHISDMVNFEKINKAFLNLLVKRIVIYSDRRIVIEFNFTEPK